jgi:hypothetical protein
MTSMEEAKAVQLISVNEETGEFQIVPESMNIIASCECPVSVVMIAGWYFCYTLSSNLLR